MIVSLEIVTSIALLTGTMYIAQLAGTTNAIAGKYTQFRNRRRYKQLLRRTLVNTLAI